MSGLLARLTGAVPATGSNLLGLSSQAHISKEMRMERDREIGRRIVFGQVLATEVRVIEQMSYVAGYAVSRINRTGELLASAVPEERHRSDSVTDTATVLINQAMAKLGNL